MLKTKSIIASPKLKDKQKESISTSVDFLLSKLSDREKVMIKMRFGIGEKNAFTLDAIGKKYGITRERVRQIEESAVAKLVKIVEDSSLTFFSNAALNLLKTAGGVMATATLVKHLYNSLECSDKSDIQKIEFALNLSEEFSTVQNTIRFKPFVYLNTLPKTTLHKSSDFIVKKLEAGSKIMDIETLKTGLQKHLDLRLSGKFVLHCALICRDLFVTEEGKIGLEKWTNINPKNIHDKVLFVLRESKVPLHFTEIRKRVSDKKFSEKNINVQAVHNELIRGEEFVLIGRGIYGLRERGFEPGTVAQVIVKILKKHGPMEKSKIVEEVMKVRQVKLITIYLNLKNKNFFTRVGRSVYAVK